MNRTIVLFSAAAFLGTAIFGQDVSNSNNAGGNGNGKALGLDKIIHETYDSYRAKPGGGGSPQQMRYHGGPVMTGTVHVYYIWYGNWSGNSAPTILEHFANSIGGSPYFNINQTYSVSGMPVSGQVALSGVTTDNYSQGKALSDTAIRNVVSSAIASNRLLTSIRTASISC